ncbi:MAG: response regulator transcription factor [Taibaiella sp.]|nr:response regulator transcription factor [Taibaiella sp.]
MDCKVIIADDHPIFRTGIREVVSGIPGVELCGEAKDGLEAYQLILSARPDVAILDLEMPKLSGLDVCRKVQAEKHDTQFIILTMHKDRHFFDEAMRSGVAGYLLKDNAVDELVACVQTVAGGLRYASKTIEAYLVRHDGREQFPPEVKALYETLTPTERVIVKLVSQSSTSHEIADNLFVSPNTIENHRANIARKLHLEGKNSLLKFALMYKSLL